MRGEVGVSEGVEVEDVRQLFVLAVVEFQQVAEDEEAQSGEVEFFVDVLLFADVFADLFDYG